MDAYIPSAYRPYICLLRGMQAIGFHLGTLFSNQGFGFFFSEMLGYATADGSIETPFRSYYHP
jgi:hypothetical protein